jgi:methionyl-tRNA synthetase
MVKTTYLTTTLPYVNADPHIGFALELVQADAYARAKQLAGLEVFLNTGTDEHGSKIYQAAEAASLSPQAYVDDYAARFKSLPAALGVIPEINFIRTTDPHHILAAQEFWRRCASAGDIYKKQYQVKYCVGCELEKTDSELVDGRCPLHPNQELELIEEENYFFKFSNYQQKLLDLYESNPDFVLPHGRFTEIKSFVTSGLQDFSISRLASKMPWGIPVPDDAEQVMYVWFDALVNYVSAIGWPEDETKFKAWWPVTQFAGKDNLRQQSAMWQAMLLSAGLAPSKQIMIHGFITSNGQKMSKSLGNVVNPLELVNEYGVDALRYYLLRHIHPFEDSDFTMEKFKEAYNAGLANGLGNLVSRVMKMAQDNLPSASLATNNDISPEYFELVNNFEFNKAADLIWQKIAELDQKIQSTEPFKLVKSNPEQGIKLIGELVANLYNIGQMLNPFMPETGETIKKLVKANKAPEAPLFPRKD